MGAVGIALHSAKKDFCYNAMTLQGLRHDGQCGRFVTGLGHEAFDNLVFVTDGTPEIMHDPEAERLRCQRALMHVEQRKRPDAAVGSHEV